MDKHAALRRLTHVRVKARTGAQARQRDLAALEGREDLACALQYHQSGFGWHQALAAHLEPAYAQRLAELAQMA